MLIGVHYVDGGLFRNFPVRRSRRVWKCGWRKREIGEIQTGCTSQSVPITISSTPTRWKIVSCATFWSRQKTLNQYKVFDLANVAGWSPSSDTILQWEAFAKVIKENRDKNLVKAITTRQIKWKDSFMEDNNKKLVIYQAFPAGLATTNLRRSRTEAFRRTDRANSETSQTKRWPGIRELGTTHIMADRNHRTCHEDQLFGLRHQNAIIQLS